MLDLRPKKRPPNEKMKKVRVCYYLPKEIRDYVVRRAKIDGMSRSCFISALVREKKDDEEGDIF